MTSGAKIGFLILGLVVVVGIPVTIILVKRKSNTATAAAVASVPTGTVAIPPPPPPCEPFSKAQQDAQKSQLRAKCANKLLIPIVGEVQYVACLKSVDANLTPIKNC